MRFSAARRYTLIGAICGLAYPLLAIVYTCGLSDLEGFGACSDRVGGMDLYWLVCTAPLFIGLVARMAGKRQDEINRLNRILAGDVESCTRELVVVNSEVDLLLDAVPLAVFRVDQDLMICGRSSAYTRILLGRGDPEGSLGALLTLRHGHDKQVTQLEEGLRRCFGCDATQWSGLAQQLPSLFRLRPGQTLKASFAPHFDDEGVVNSVLIVISDATQESHLERVNSGQAIRLAVLKAILTTSRSEVEDLLGDLSSMIEKITSLVLANTRAEKELALTLLSAIQIRSLRFQLEAVERCAHEAGNALRSAPLEPEAGAKALKPHLDEMEFTLMIYHQAIKELFHWNAKPD